MKILTTSLFVISSFLFSCQNNTDSATEQNGADTVVTGLEGTRDQQGQISQVKMDTTSGQQPAGSFLDTSSGLMADEQFIKEQIVGNYNEIALARLATKKSADKEIKTIAQQLVKDHTGALDKLKSMASAKKLEVTSSPAADATAMVSTLDTKQAAAFDKAWTEALLEKHKSSIAKYEAEAKTVSDADLKAFVNQTLPKLRMHLDKLMAYHGQIK